MPRAIRRTSPLHSGSSSSKSLTWRSVFRRWIIWARETLAEVTLKQKIHADVAEGMDKSQREHLLRRQLEAIKKELGEVSGEGSLVEEYRKKIAEVKMPEQVLKEAERELDRLERTSEQQVEHG